MTTSHSFYDELRANDPNNFSPIFGGNHIGRNLHRYDGGMHGEQGGPIVMCHVPQFMRYTEMSDEKLIDSSELGFGASVAMILAIDHWNNGNGVVVKQIEGINQRCKIRFTTEVFDTQAAAIPAVKGLTRMMTRSPDSIVEPQPCAILGTVSSSVASKFATVTGVYDLLQVAPGASSDDLDNKALYPLFSRTHTSDGGAAKILPKFMNEVMNVKKFAIVYIADDGYGLSYVNVVQNYARAKGFIVLQVPLKSNPATTKEDLMEDMKKLLDSNLNYVVGVFFKNNYADIMEAAGELGVAGPGKMWLFCGGLSEYLYEGLGFKAAQKFVKNSMLAKATYGNAVITDGGGAPGTPEYDMFLQEWKKLGDNPETLSYINSKQPLSPEGESFDFNRTKEWFYTQPPNNIAIFAYEALIGMGISACQAAADAGSTFEENDVFTGEDHHRAFLNVNFRSASGQVKIGPDNFSRNDLSTYYIAANIQEINSTDTTVSLQGRGYAYFDAVSGKWSLFKNGAAGAGFATNFVFSDGTTDAPPEIGLVQADMSLISDGVKSYCLILCSVAIIMAIAFVVYTVKMRKRSIIRMSQPPFLVMICVGTMIMACSIIPFSVDEGILGQRGLNVSCSLVPWFFSLGFVVTFAALFSKLWRVNKVVDASRSFRRVTITVQDVLVPFATLVISNTLILSIWQGVAPSLWKRITIEKNEFDQVLASEGACRSENSLWFISAIIVVDGIALLLACYQAYIGREVRTEMNESTYIGMAMISIFQSFFFGVPMLFITKDNRSTSLFVSTSICFVVCVATLLFIFVPKILAQRKEDAVNIGRRSRVTGLSIRAAQLRGGAVHMSMGARLQDLRAQQRFEAQALIQPPVASVTPAESKVPMRTNQEGLGGEALPRKVDVQDMERELAILEVRTTTSCEQDVKQEEGTQEVRIRNSCGQDGKQKESVQEDRARTSCEEDVNQKEVAQADRARTSCEEELAQEDRARSSCEQGVKQEASAQEDRARSSFEQVLKPKVVTRNADLERGICDDFK